MLGYSRKSLTSISQWIKAFQAVSFISIFYVILEELLLNNVKLWNREYWPGMTLKFRNISPNISASSLCFCVVFVCACLWCWFGFKSHGPSVIVHNNSNHQNNAPQTKNPRYSIFNLFKDLLRILFCLTLFIFRYADFIGNKID